jgi:hypothetical protein
LGTRGSIVVGTTLLLALAGCGGTSGGDAGGGAPAAATTAAAAAGGGSTQAAGPGRGQPFTKATPDQSFCDILTEQDTAGMQMVTKGPPKPGSNQVAADQPVAFICSWNTGSWGYNDTIGITVYPTADRAKQDMSVNIHGTTAKDVVRGADQSDYLAGTGDRVKSILRARFGRFVFGVSLNDTVAKLSADDAMKAAVGLATIMAERCPNLR